MNDSSILGLINNAALLLALVLVFDFIRVQIRPGQYSIHLFTLGVLIGAIGVCIMLTPWVLLPGLVFDTRSILLSISGLFFGAVPTLIAMIITAALRIYQGGSGTLTGVSVIFATGIIGIVWRYLRKPSLEKISWKELLIFGLITHLVMLALMFTLPLETALKALANISLPVLLIYPLGTTLLGKLLSNRLLREQITQNLLSNEEKLRESESKFRSLFQNNRAVMILLNPATGQIIEANAAASNYYGWNQEELKSKNINEINTLTQQEVKEKLQLSIDEKQNYFQFQHRLANGEIRDVEVYSGPIQHAGNNLLYAIVHDITERKEVEQALQKSEQTYRSLFESLLNGFAYCKMKFENDIPQDFLYIEVNKAFEGLTGLKDTEGKWVSEVIPGIRDADPKLFEIYGRVALTGIPEKFEQYVESLNDWYSISVYSPQKEYFVAVFDVITKRKKAEAQIQEQLDELRRWHKLTLGRENRVLELKHEVDELLVQMGKLPRYPSAEEENQLEEKK
jgi:PAS domain S-box-containing protein